MARTTPVSEAILNLRSVDDSDHLRFIEVEGELHGAAVDRWGELLRDVVEQEVDGIVVDMRGCRGFDPHCLEAMLAAAATLRARGGAGLTLIVLSGSALAQRLPLLASGELAMHDSVGAAVRALYPDRLADRG